MAKYSELDDLRLDDANFPPASGKKGLPVYYDKYNDLLDWIEDSIYGVTGSITMAADGGTASLVGDVLAPGSNKFYATDDSGDRGWQSVSVFTHIGYAENEDGDGFTTTFDPALRYVGVVNSNADITPTAGTFAGEWRPVGYPESRRCEYNYVRRFDTENKGNDALPFNFQTLGSQAWYYEGTHRRVYFTYFGNLAWDAPVQYVTNYISYYDLDTETFGDPEEIEPEYPDIADAHIHAFPIVSTDGYINVLYEKSSASAGWNGNAAHNTPIVLKRSDNPEDISAFTRIGQITPTAAGTSYPHFFSLSNGNLYAMYRGVSHGSGVIQYSDDGGATWQNMSGTNNNVTEVWRLTNGDEYAYFMQVSGPMEHGINVVAMDYDANPSPDTIDNLYFLHSDDGITWQNIASWKGLGAGEFSKNVVSSGYITQAELDTNCKMVTSTSAPNIWNFRRGQITRDGTPVIAYCKENTTTNFIDGAYIGVWNGAAWEEIDVTTRLWPGEVLNKPAGSIAKTHFIIPYSSSEWDVGVSFVDEGRATYVTDGNIIKSGDLSGNLESSAASWSHGPLYFVVTTDGATGWGSTAGSIFKGLGTQAADANNTCKMVKLGLKVLRTTDTGANWHTVKEVHSSGPFGMTRGGCYNVNYFDDDKFFCFIGDNTTTNNELPNASDTLMIYENLHNRDV